MLTNYEITRALVGERQRDLLNDAEHTRRTRLRHRPSQTRRSTARLRSASWLVRPSARRGGATRTAAAEPNPCQ